MKITDMPSPEQTQAAQEATEILNRAYSEGFLPKLPKGKKSHEEELREQISEIRRLDRRTVMPEVFEFLKSHAVKLEQQLKALQGRKV